MRKTLLIGTALLGLAAGAVAQNNGEYSKVTGQVKVDKKVPERLFEFRQFKGAPVLDVKRIENETYKGTDVGIVQQVGPFSARFIGSGQDDKKFSSGAYVSGPLGWGMKATAGVENGKSRRWEGVVERQFGEANHIRPILGGSSDGFGGGAIGVYGDWVASGSASNHREYGGLIGKGNGKVSGFVFTRQKPGEQFYRARFWVGKATASAAIENSTALIQTQELVRNSGSYLANRYFDDGSVWKDSWELGNPLFIEDGFRKTDGPSGATLKNSFGLYWTPAAEGSKVYPHFGASIDSKKVGSQPWENLYTGRAGVKVNDKWDVSVAGHSDLKGYNGLSVKANVRL